MKSIPRWFVIMLVSLTLLLSGALFGAEIPRHCKIETKSEKIGDGTIVYDIAGQGPVILLLHGLFAAKEQWQSLVCLLASAGYTAIAPDLPGYGKSDNFPLAAYPLENQVDILHRFANRIRIKKLGIAGSSMGGTIASLYADRFPGQTRTVAFIGSPLGVVDWAGRVRDAIYTGINPFIPVNEYQFDLELRLLFVKPPDIPAPEKQAIISNYVVLNRHYVDVWNIVNLYDDVLWKKPSPKIPTLIVWGKDDQIYDIAGAAKLHRRIPGSEVHRLPHAGHLLLVENADEVASIYLDFLHSHNGAGGLPTKKR